MKTVIVDIDGTISDSRWRLHFVRPPPGEKRDNEAFHSRCRGDTVIPSVRTLVRSLSYLNNQIVLCTGRPDRWRDITMDWLDESDVPYDQLFMRPADKENMPAPEYKLGVLNELRSKNHEVIIAIEDQQNVVDMWRANGVHCLQTQAI